MLEGLTRQLISQDGWKKEGHHLIFKVLAERHGFVEIQWGIEMTGVKDISTTDS